MRGSSFRTCEEMRRGTSSSCDGLHGGLELSEESPVAPGLFKDIATGGRRLLPVLSPSRAALRRAAARGIVAFCDQSYLPAARPKGADAVHLSHCVCLPV